MNIKHSSVMHVTHVTKHQRNNYPTRLPSTRPLRVLSAVTSIGSFESDIIENAKESNYNNTNSVSPKTESTLLSSKSNEPNKTRPPSTISIKQVPQSHPSVLSIHPSYEPQQSIISESIQTVPSCMRSKPLCRKTLSDQISKHSISSPSRVYPQQPNLSISDFDPMNSALLSRNSVKTRNTSSTPKQTTPDRSLYERDDRNKFCDTNIKKEDNRRRNQRQSFKRCCPCCSPCCCLFTGILLSLLFAGLATTITLASLSKATTSSTSFTSTSITTMTATTTTAATTVTITSNTCTSSWNGITLYNLCTNCPNINSYQQYSYIYIAIATQTRITFAFREDTGYFALDDTSVRNILSPTIELLINGGFEIGNLSSWIYCNPSSSSFPGTLKKTSDNFVAQGKTYAAHSGNYYYLDGAVGNADYLSQMFTTIIGQTYNISFWLYNQGSGTNSNANVIISI